ncbi:unnamed protein product [Somion occarium]|uniref:ATP synthase protein MI25 n=1 Tax=Somion occarium TaxID=3059160 RepID=A0ABP1CIP7_9APHY
MPYFDTIRGLFVNNFTRLQYVLVLLTCAVTFAYHLCRAILRESVCLLLDPAKHLSARSLASTSVNHEGETRCAQIPGDPQHMYMCESQKIPSTSSGNTSPAVQDTDDKTTNWEGVSSVARPRLDIARLRRRVEEKEAPSGRTAVETTPRTSATEPIPRALLRRNAYANLGLGRPSRPLVPQSPIRIQGPFIRRPLIPMAHQATAASKPLPPPPKASPDATPIYYPGLGLCYSSRPVVKPSVSKRGSAQRLAKPLLLAPVTTTATVVSSPATRLKPSAKTFVPATPRAPTVAQKSDSKTGISRDEDANLDTPITKGAVLGSRCMISKAGKENGERFRQRGRRAKGPRALPVV